jgi:hypothetical protein
MSIKIEDHVTKETISNVTLLLAAQVVKDALEDLKYTSAYRANLKRATDQFLTAIHQSCNVEINKLWQNDIESKARTGVDNPLALHLTQAIADIGKAIAKSKDPIACYNIRYLLRNDIDMSMIKIVEMKRKPYKKKK